MELRDYYDNLVLRIVNDKCYDPSGTWVYVRKGDYICNAAGNWVFEIRGDKVYDTRGNWVYKIRQDQRQAGTGHMHTNPHPQPRQETPAAQGGYGVGRGDTHPAQGGYSVKTGDAHPVQSGYGVRTEVSPPRNVYTEAPTHTPQRPRYQQPSTKSRLPIIIASVAAVVVFGIIIAVFTGRDNGTDSGGTGTAEANQPYGYQGYETNDYTQYTGQNGYDTPPHYEPAYTALSFGSTFQFYGSSGQIEITFGTTVFWGIVENDWSPHNGATVFAIPVTVRNISPATGGLNPFDLTMFGTYGLQLDSIGLFFDYDITWESNMRAGASKTRLLYVLYDGNGEYVVEFAAGFGFGDTNRVSFHIEYTGAPHISEFNIEAFPPSTFVPLSTYHAFTLGDTFEFGGSSGDIEITLGTYISWMYVQNSWAQHYGAAVFAIPVYITNIGAETGGLNPFDFIMFGSDGLRLDAIGYAFDEDITWEGNMQPGATQTGRLFFLYVGDGQYAIEFAAGLGFGDSVEVVFHVTR